MILIYKIWSLTAGVDVIEGTDGDDVINGVSSSLSSARTLDAGDQIDGGKGTDTLKVTLDGSFSGFTGDGYLKNVEMVELTNTGNIGRTFAAKQVEGVEKYTLNGAVDLSDLATTDVTVAIDGREKGTTTIAYATDVTKGTADTLALELNGLGKAKAGSVAEEQVTITAAGIEELNVTATGSNFVRLGSNDSETLTVEGAGSFKLVAASTGTKTVDASAATGVMDLDLTAVTAAGQVAEVHTGSADDTITVDAADMRANATVDGGEGADTLFIKGANATVQFNMTNVETVKLGALTGGALTGGDLTFSAAKTTGLEKIIATKDVTESALFASMGDIDLNLEFQGAHASGDTITSDHTGATTLTVTTPADGATTAAPTTNDLDATLTKSTSLDLSVASKMEYTGTITASKAASVNVAIDGEIDGATISAGEAEGVVISKVENNSDFVLTAAKATELNVTAAKDLSLATSTLSKLEVLTVNTAGTFTGVHMTALSTANLSGLGAVELGSLGSATQEYALQVSAEGLSKNTTATGSAALEIGTLTTKGAAITVNASAVMGNVILGAIDADSGAIAGSGTAGDVTIELNGTGGTTTLDAITGNNVTISAAEAQKAVTYGGNISVEKNLVINGSDLTATKVDGLAGAGAISATGTTFTAEINGGIGNDLFKISGTDNKTTSITVSGDLGMGTNKVEVLANQTGAAGVTIDVTSLSAGTNGTVEITGGDGDDTIKLGASTETVIFAATATGNGKDAITGFTAGASGDKLDFSAFVSNVAAAAITANSGAAVFSDTVNWVAKANITDTVDGVLATADFGAGKTFAAIGDGEAGAVVVTDSTGGAHVYYAYDSDATAGVTATVTLVGTLTGVTTGFVAGNFDA